VVQGRLGAEHHPGPEVVSDTWSPDQYQKFKAERDQPFVDLLALLEPAATVVDLGCGDGRLTSLAHTTLGAATTLGIDSSEAMLAVAPTDVAGLTFEVGDIGSWTAPAGSFDAVVANAALHWVPDHAAVLARWVAALKPGGQLAVQVPSNVDHPSHTVVAEVCDELGLTIEPDPVAVNVLRPEQYAGLLDDLGAVDQHVRLQVYVHHFGQSGDVVEWVKGTTLTRVRRATDDAGYEAFLTRYRERLLSVIGDRSPYTYLFKRILFRARF
jgi:trans-aconitate 2-methyltransferase